MRRFLIILLVIIMHCPMLSAWGRLGHATVAKVAQDHLSVEAEKALAGYLDGLTLAALASDADTYRGEWTRDMGFVPSNIDEARPPWLKSFDFSTPLNIAPYSHMITVDKEFRCYRTDNLDGEYINNIAYYVDILAKELKAHASEMDSFERYKAIALIVHFVGDMHCPVHIVYRPDNALKGKYKLWWNGEELSLHGVWDNAIFRNLGYWSYSDMALLVDTASEKQIQLIVDGDIYDYASDSAECCWPAISACHAGITLPATYATDMRPLLFSQLRNAGYRLAEILNDIFVSNE